MHKAGHEFESSRTPDIEAKSTVSTEGQVVDIIGLEPLPEVSRKTLSS